jgi:tetratricopeptide (TPR) repeat protein
MVCWGIADLVERKRLVPAFVLPIAGIIVLLALSLATRRQINYWATEESLWRHTLAVTDRNWVAESELGADLAMHGNVAEAVQHFRYALAINPADVSSNMGLAIYEFQSKDFLAAIRHYQIVVQHSFVKASIAQHADLGLAKSYDAMGDHENSRESLRRAQMLSTP